MKDNYLKTELYNLMKSDSSIFEFIQAGSLDGMWYWDLEAIENEWMSPKFWETLGYDPEEKKHLSSEWQDLIFQEDLVFAVANFEKHRANPDFPYNQIVRYKHKNGSTVWIRCRGLAIRDENGKAIRMLGAHTDITDLKETELELSRLTKEYEKVFNGTLDAMFLVRVLENGNFHYVRNNLAHQNKTGISLEQIVSKTPQELLGKELGDLICEKYLACVASRKSITFEELVNTPNGDYTWLTKLTPIVEGDLVTHIVGSSTDITERKNLENELENFANYDKLTGLPNRRLFFERLDRIVKESERDQQQFVLLFLDLDGFKYINDNYGHAVGDEVLITTGNRLLQCIRKSDTVARMGGDEFTLIIRNIENETIVPALLTKIQNAIQEVMLINNTACKVNASIGVAIYPTHGIDGEALLRNADSSMYDVKRTHKSDFEFSEDTPQTILATT